VLRFFEFKEMFYFISRAIFSRKKRKALRHGRRNAPDAYGVMSVLKKESTPFFVKVDEQGMIC